MTQPPIHTDPPTASRTTLRRERWIIIGLALLIAASAVIGWATIPTDADLLEVASTDANTGERIAAMNSLIARGYWDDRSLAELRTFLDDSPPEIEGFVVAMHGSLLRKR